MSDAPGPASLAFHRVTALAPGAIGIIQLHGCRARLDQVLCALVGSPVPLSARHVRFADIDEGVVVAVDERTCHLMPHGGVRVMQRLARRLRELGVEEGEMVENDRVPPSGVARSLFPEAATSLEADMLFTLARAASPAAVDLLVDQPRRWREMLSGDLPEPARILDQSRVLDQLIQPSTVVLVGAANVGKSTLSNAIIGRSASLTADLPGTTRDWVGSLAQVRTPLGLVSVRWIDTPGYRAEAGESEAVAWDLALPLIREADLVVLVGDCEQGWSVPVPVERRPQLAVLNKCDLRTAEQAEALRQQSPVETTIPASALRGRGLDRLVAAIGQALGLSELDPGLPWAFSHVLRRLLEAGDATGLRAYVGVDS